MDKILRTETARYRGVLFPARLLLPAAAALILLLAGGVILNLAPRRVEVTFIIENPTASSVALIGDFNDWSQESMPLNRENGVWKISVNLNPGRYHYAFVIDGKKYVPDTGKPSVDDGFGNKNSIIEVSNINPASAGKEVI